MKGLRLRQGLVKRLGRGQGLGRDFGSCLVQRSNRARLIKNTRRDGQGLNDIQHLALAVRDRLSTRAMQRRPIEVGIGQPLAQHLQTHIVGTYGLP